MRNLIRSPLTWLVVAEFVVVSALVVLAWSVAGAAAAREHRRRKLTPAGHCRGREAGAARSAARAEPRKRLLAGAPGGAQPRTGHSRAARVANRAQRDGGDEALPRDGRVTGDAA